jgi:hypothetical protein
MKVDIFDLMPTIIDQDLLVHKIWRTTPRIHACGKRSGRIIEAKGTGFMLNILHSRNLAQLPFNARVFSEKYI